MLSYILFIYLSSLTSDKDKNIYPKLLKMLSIILNISFNFNCIGGQWISSGGEGG